MQLSWILGIFIKTCYFCLIPIILLGKLKTIRFCNCPIRIPSLCVFEENIRFSFSIRIPWFWKKNQTEPSVIRKKSGFRAAPILCTVVNRPDGKLVKSTTVWTSAVLQWMHEGALFLLLTLFANDIWILNRSFVFEAEEMSRNCHPIWLMFREIALF